MPEPIIIRYSPLKLNLCGYVGVGPDHPLFGFDRSSVRAVGVDAHGGIDYAARLRGRTLAPPFGRGFHGGASGRQHRMHLPRRR